LASISESVKQGLNIMDEKYKVMDVACSDSEEEDEGGAVVFRLVSLSLLLYKIYFVLNLNWFTVLLWDPMIHIKIGPCHMLLVLISG